MERFFKTLKAQEAHQVYRETGAPARLYIVGPAPPSIDFHTAVEVQNAWFGVTPKPPKSYVEDRTQRTRYRWRRIVHVRYKDTADGETTARGLG